MEKTTLKNLRLITPGVIILFFGLLYVSRGWENFISSTADVEVDPSAISGKAIVIGLFGILYYALDLRGKIWRNKFLPDVHTNIFDSLLSGRNYTQSQEQKIRDKKNLTHIFYSFIDNDASLTNKSKDVYANGYVASTVCDIIVVGGFFTLLYTITGIITSTWHYYSFAAFSIAVIALCTFLLIRVRKKHVELSNDQLFYIKQKYSNELTQKLNELL